MPRWLPAGRALLSPLPSSNGSCLAVPCTVPSLVMFKYGSTADTASTYPMYVGPAQRVTSNPDTTRTTIATTLLPKKAATVPTRCDRSTPVVSARTRNHNEPFG